MVIGWEVCSRTGQERGNRMNPQPTGYDWSSRGLEAKAKKLMAQRPWALGTMGNQRRTIGQIGQDNSFGRDNQASVPNSGSEALVHL